MMHELKIWPEHFQAIIEGRKRFEIRSVEDRSYDDGDTLELQEWFPDEERYTNRRILAKVTLVHAGIGMQKGYVALGIRVYAWQEEGDTWQKWTIPHNDGYWENQPEAGQCKPTIPRGKPYLASVEAMHCETQMVHLSKRAERLEKHVAKLKRKLASHKRRSGKRVHLLRKKIWLVQDALKS
jgi:hypothetical protein